MHSYTDVLAEFGVGSAHPGGFTLTKELLDNVAIHKEMHVLDCGCGTGQTASYIQKSFQCKVTAIDLHPLMIEKARNRFNITDQPITLVEGSIEKMPFPDLSFDLVLSESAAIFTKVGLTLAEYARVLKPKGKILLNEMVLLEQIPAKDVVNIKQMYNINELLLTDDWIKRLANVGITKVDSCMAGPISSLLEQVEDRGNDFDPSEEINPIFHEMLTEHHQLSQTYATQLGFLLLVAEKS